MSMPFVLWYGLTIIVASLLTLVAAVFVSRNRVRTMFLAEFPPSSPAHRVFSCLVPRGGTISAEEQMILGNQMLTSVLKYRDAVAILTPGVLHLYVKDNTGKTVDFGDVSLREDMSFSESAEGRLTHARWIARKASRIATLAAAIVAGLAFGFALTRGGIADTAQLYSEYWREELAVLFGTFLVSFAGVVAVCLFTLRGALRRVVLSSIARPLEIFLHKKDASAFLAALSKAKSPPECPSPFRAT